MRAKRVMSANLPRTKTEGNRYHVDALPFRLEARMESLLLFRRALPSPTMCRFIPALSVPLSPVRLALHEISLDVSNHTQLNQREDKHP